MVFSAPIFLFGFLPLVLIVAALVPRRWTNAALLAASLGFYWWGSGGQLVLLVVSITANHHGIRVMAGTHGAARRRWLATVVAANIAMLAVFKYTGFAWSILRSGDPPAWLAVALPIGISFYTFQTVSAAVDVYRGQAEPLPRWVDFALFVSFFPQLIAGPIVRFAQMAPQLRCRRWSLEAAYAGGARFVFGLGKKVLIADSAAVVADAVFGRPGVSGTEAWLGALAFTVQIYFDFSGYSDMAIGLGQVLGFRLPENFDRPYGARSVTEFWRRWHITLSRWFRDYLYIPLGGSQRSSAVTYRNLGIVFLLTGLWHGAAWTFVVWGAWHGSWLAVERASGRRHGQGVGRWVSTFVITVVGWVVFRASDLTEAWTLLRAMATDAFGGVDPVLWYDLGGRPLVAVAIGLASVAIPRTWVTGVWLGAAVPGTVAASESVPTPLPSTDAPAAIVAPPRPVAGADTDTRTVIGSAPRPDLRTAAQVAMVVVGLPVVAVAVAAADVSPFLYFQF